MSSHTSPGPAPSTQDAVRVVGSPLGPVVLLDRPERRNALTLDMWRALGARVVELAAETPGPVYLMGAGGYFASGADLGALAFARTHENHAREFVEGVVTALLQVHLLEREVVAVVEGGAAGGGVEIMAACDRRVAIGVPRLVFPFGQHGMELDGLTRWRLAALVGAAQAERLADGRHVVEVDEALRLGLFDAQHTSLADLAAAESAGPESVADLAAGSAAALTARSAGTRSLYTRRGEEFAAAVTRASAPMLRAFPPHRTFA